MPDVIDQEHTRDLDGPEAKEEGPDHDHEPAGESAKAEGDGAIPPPPEVVGKGGGKAPEGTGGATPEGASPEGGGHEEPAKPTPKFARAKAPKRRLPIKIQNRLLERDIAKLVAEKGAEATWQAIGSASKTREQVKAEMDALIKLNLFASTFAALPEKSGMAPATREAMLHIVTLAVLGIDAEKKLWKKRFGLDLEATTGAAAQDWTQANIVIAWRQLDVLPDEHVTQNNMLKVFKATKDQGGGTYAESEQTVRIGQNTTDVHHIEHTVRHEVGHAVHAKTKGVIDPWLESAMGFHNYPSGAAGVSQWIEDLGGWPTTFKVPGDWLPSFVTDGRRQKIINAIVSYTGSGAWGPTRATILDPAASKQEQALLDAIPHVKNAVKQSTSHWYKNWSNFENHGGHRYFLNHWYNHPIRFGNKGDAVITASGDSYTAMSHYEFFANAYAEYFGDPAGAKDPSKWGGKMPSDVKDFFAVNVVPHKNTTERVKKTG